MLTKVKVTNSQSWCACCGTPADTGEKLVKIEMSGSSRFVKLSHLISWSSLSGEGEVLKLDKRRSE